MHIVVLQVIPRDRLACDDVVVILQVLHGVHDAGGDAVVVDVYLHVLGEIACFRDLCQDRLPCFYDVSVLIRLIVAVFEYALPFQIIQVVPDVVVAQIEVVAVVVVRHHGVVPHGGQYPSHSRVFLFAEPPCNRLVQMLGIVEDVRDLLHQDVRRCDDHVHDERQAEHQHDAADCRSQDLSVGRLHLAGHVEQLLDDRPDRERKCENDADQSHGPIDIVDGSVREEDIHQEVVLPVVRRPLDAGEHLEQL